MSSPKPLDLKKYAPLKGMPLKKFVVTWTRSFEELPDPCPEANPLITALIHDGPAMLEELEEARAVLSLISAIDPLTMDEIEGAEPENAGIRYRITALLPTEGGEA